MEFGVHLGRLLQQPALILLQGDLGAGKSVLARGIARGLGVSEEVPITSPTFTLMNHYPARLDLYHFDLYRLAEPDELIEIGFDDYAFGDGVALVEWPERLENEATEGLWVHISHLGEGQRELKFSAVGKVAEELLQRLQTAVEK
jgi:tRNA threonylcarbamoyladenosine biosynthesis protein TsaE